MFGLSEQDEINRMIDLDTVSMCGCMAGPNFPDPKCVRCHGTGKPAQTYSIVMMKRPNENRSWPIPLNLWGDHKQPKRFTHDAALRLAVDGNQVQKTRAYGLPMANCIVNVYLKAPKTPAEPKLAGDDYTARIG